MLFKRKINETRHFNRRKSFKAANFKVEPTKEEKTIAEKPYIISSFFNFFLYLFFIDIN